MTTDQADAELIAVCDSLPSVLRDLAAAPHSLGGDAPEWLAFDRIADTIPDSRPMTLEGVMAKARAAMAQAVNCGEADEREPDGIVAMWAWSVVKDLLRIGSSGACRTNARTLAR